MEEEVVRQDRRGQRDKYGWSVEDRDMNVVKQGRAGQEEQWVI